MKFQELLANAIKKNNSLLCVGLDPDPGKFSKNLSLLQFNKSIIDQTADLVCAYKPNIAFYEAEGLSALEELKNTISYLKKNYGSIPIVLDAKRADVPNTARMYAKSLYEFWQADATTVYPHLGLDSIKPFLDYEDRLTILIIKTSNPDSGKFQNYLKMAREVAKWKYKNIGIAVGATYPYQLKQLRTIFPSKIFLSAGIGAQSSEVKAAVQAGIDKNRAGIMFNASRSIIFSQNPRQAAQKLKDEINQYR